LRELGQPAACRQQPRREQGPQSDREPARDQGVAPSCIRGRRLMRSAM
jgi:hypothetical protein